MENVTNVACADAEKVGLRMLNQRFGLPEGTLKPSKNLYPTIPSAYVDVCKMGANHLHSLPPDVQAMLIACLIVSHNAFKHKIPPAYGKPFNSGVQFGELGFKPLSSFRTL